MKYDRDYANFDALEIEAERRLENNARYGPAHGPLTRDELTAWVARQKREIAAAEEERRLEREKEQREFDLEMKMAWWEIEEHPWTYGRYVEEDDR